MSIKILKQFLVFVLAISVFASCTKEEPVIIEEQEVKQEESSESTMQDLFKADLMITEDAAESKGKMCFKLNFPVEIVYPDKTTGNVDSFEALETTFDSWYKENKGSKEEPMLNFPVEVTLADGTIESVVDERALLALMKECFENENVVERKCFEINFPVNVKLDGQEEELTVNSGEEFRTLLKDRDEEMKYEFVYPITVTLAKGDAKTLETRDDLKSLRAFCNKKDKEDEDKDWDNDSGNILSLIESRCFEMAFPVELNLPDASKISVNDVEAFYEAVNVYRNDKEALSKISLSYPVQVVSTQDLSTVELNSQEELKAFIVACKEDRGDRDEDRDELDWEGVYENIGVEFLRNKCFQIEFPINFELKDGSLATVNNYDEIFGTLIEESMGNNEELPELVLAYPLMVTLNEDRTSVTINSEEELKSLYESCELDWEEDDDRGHGNDDDDIDHEDWDESEVFQVLRNRCFEVQLPISITTNAGDVVELENYETIFETITELFRNNEVDLEEITLNYPVTVILKDGATEQINSEQDFEELIDNCKDDRGEDWDDIDIDIEIGEGWDFGDFDFEDFDLDQINFEDFDFTNFDFSGLEDFKILCFQINFPVTIDVSAEERISAESFGDLLQQMFEIVLTNRAEDIEPKINYPITVTLEDKTIETINSDEELEDLVKKCND